jgi:hypothetical protein
MKRLISAIAAANSIMPFATGQARNFEPMARDKENILEFLTEIQSIDPSLDGLDVSLQP